MSRADASISLDGAPPEGRTLTRLDRPGRLARIAALLLATTLGACHDPLMAGPATLVIDNQASDPIDGIYIRRCDATENGQNRLRAPLPSLVSRRFAIETGCLWAHATIGGVEYDSLQVAAGDGDERSWILVDRAGEPVGAGADWNPIAAPRGSDGADPTWYSLAFGNGTFVATGPGLRGASPDGERWDVESGLPSDSAGSFVAFGNGRFVATAPGGLATSVDGRTWTYHAVPGVFYPAALAYGNGTWVVADNRFDAQDYIGFLLSKDDGATWEIVKGALPWGVPTGMAYADGKFVMVGGGGLIATSTNGRVWKQASVAPDATIDDGVLRGPVYAQNRWISVTGNGSVFFSTTTSFWEFLPDWLVGGDDGAPYNFNGLAYGNGFFAAVGLQGTIWTSQQGKAWSKRAWSDPGTSFTDVAYGNGRFVAIGSTFAVSR